MKDLALHILDISENSIRAMATEIEISLTLSKFNDKIVFRINDNGCGMDEDALARVKDPYFTSRTTRKVGMGIPLLIQNAEATGGYVTINSEVNKGTSLLASFVMSHIDLIPMGDIVGVLEIILSSNPTLNIIIKVEDDNESFSISTKELLETLEVSNFDNYEIKKLIKEYLHSNIHPYISNY